jgi:hypothetical protein
MLKEFILLEQEHILSFFFGGQYCGLNLDHPHSFSFLPSLLPNPLKAIARGFLVLFYVSEVLFYVSILCIHHIPSPSSLSFTLLPPNSTLPDTHCA